MYNGNRAGTGGWPLVYLAAPLPAILTGVLLMHQAGVGSGLWLQQVGAALLGTLFCIVGMIAPRPWFTGRSWLVAAVAAVALVAATLAFSGPEGVRRWIHVGPLHLHAAAIVLPTLLLALGLAGRGERWMARPVLQGCAGVAMVLLVAQPDASQATAFGVAATVALVLDDRRSRATYPVVVLLASLSAIAWTRPDPLQPVEYVEGIVSMAAQAGFLWQAAAIAALTLLPFPFIVAAARGTVRRAPAVAAGTYFSITCIAPSVGAYPVPLLGFGLSFVIGYYSALGWLVAQPSSMEAAAGPAGRPPERGVP